jgi:hypothetical protein
MITQARGSDVKQRKYIEKNKTTNQDSFKHVGKLAVALLDLREKILP